MPLAEQTRDLLHGLRHRLRGPGRDVNVVEVGRTHCELWRVRRLRRRSLWIKRPLLARIEAAEGVDLVERSGGTEGRIEVAEGELGTVDAELHRGPRHDDQVVLISAHHIRALAAEYADHLERNALHSHLLA